jgi:hypothetical protein
MTVDRLVILVHNSLILFWLEVVWRVYAQCARRVY